MGKILAFLLFLGAGIGVYKIFQDYKAKQREERNTWPQRMAGIMRYHTSPNTLSGEIIGNETSFLQLIYLAYQVERDGFPLLENVSQAASLAGAVNGEGPLIAASLLENLQRAKTLGIFQDPANLPRLERGERPIATATGWEEEPVGVGFKLSPLLGAELSATLPNMVLMPVAIRNMQTDVVPPEADRLISMWLSIRMISPECANATREKIKADKSIR
jgi:hypothetical protein